MESINKTGNFEGCEKLNLVRVFESSGSENLSKAPNIRESPTVPLYQVNPKTSQLELTQRAPEVGAPIQRIYDCTTECKKYLLYGLYSTIVNNTNAFGTVQEARTECQSVLLPKAKDEESRKILTKIYENRIVRPVCERILKARFNFILPKIKNQGQADNNFKIALQALKNGENIFGTDFKNFIIGNVESDGVCKNCKRDAMQDIESCINEMSNVAKEFTGRDV